VEWTHSRTVGAEWNLEASFFKNLCKRGKGFFCIIIQYMLVKHRILL